MNDFPMTVSEKRIAKELLEGIIDVISEETFKEITEGIP